MPRASGRPGGTGGGAAGRSPYARAVSEEWTPEHRLSEADVARLVADHAPHLAGLAVRRLDAGWDNAVFEIGETWLLRVVHRAIALPGAVRELAVLEALAGRSSAGAPLPLAVPVPTVRGAHAGWPLWIAPRLGGTELAEALGTAELDPAGAVGVAAALGEFLRALHDPALARLGEELGLPHDPIRRGDPASVAARATDRLARLAVDLPDQHPAPRVVELLAQAAELPPAPGPPVLVHGDLHVRHVLVDSDHLTGVIDWGDTALADPCVDLSIGFAAFEGAARRALLDAYGPVPPDRAVRARALAVLLGAALAVQAAAEGRTVLLRAALASIDRATR